MAAACHHPSGEAVDTQEAVPVAVVTAGPAPIHPVVAASGEVRPAPGADFLVVPPQSARIAEMPRQAGDRVHRGDLLVRYDIPALTADAAARRSDLTRGEAQLAAARQNLERLAGLNERGIAARKDVEDARRDVAQADATVAESRTAADMAAQLAARATVRAPFDGVVVSRTHQAGDLVEPGAAEPLLRLIDPTRLEVTAALPAADLGRVALGDRAQVRGGSYPDEAAHVSGLPPAIDPATGTAAVRLAFDAPPHRPAGLAVEVEIAGAEHRAAVTVPLEALVQEGAQTFLFTVDAQKKAHRRAVTVGVRAAGRAEITAGLAAGESVVVRGQTSLPDGATVEPAPETPETAPAIPAGARAAAPSPVSPAQP